MHSIDCLLFLCYIWSVYTLKQKYFWLYAEKPNGGMIVKQFTVEFDEMVYKWLAHISEVTGKPIERIISDGVYNQIAALEEMVNTSFNYSENRIEAVIFD